MARLGGDDDVSLSGAEKLHDFRRSFLVLGVALLGVFLAPIPNPTVRSTERLWLADRSNDSVVVLGNSAIDHSSRCDADQRTIAQMIAAASGHRVRDMSYNSQGMDEALLYTAQALKAAGHEPIVFFVSVFQFASHFPFDLQTQLFFRLVAGSLHATSFTERIAAGHLVEPVVPLTVQPYTYKGRAYPDYNGVKTTFFDQERTLMRCPETLGHDRTFIESNYWNSYLRSDWQAAHVEDLATLARRSAQSKHRLLVVLLPIDHADIATLSSDLASRVEQRRSEIVIALEAARVPLLDLTNTQPSDHFADRWCACGHLVEGGRKEVASRVVAALDAAAGH